MIRLFNARDEINWCAVLSVEGHRQCDNKSCGCECHTSNRLNRERFVRVLGVEQ